MGSERYNEKYMRVNIQRIKKFLIMSEGLKKPSVFPEFLQSLDKVIAPKSCQNVTHAIIDFVTFLTETLGPQGNRYVKPESVKAQLLNYKHTFNKPARAWRQTQTYLDFTNLPSKAEIIDVKEKITSYCKSLLEKGLSRNTLNIDDYYDLMKCIVCFVVMRNACRPGSAIRIRFEHYVQACRGKPGEDYVIPLAPPEMIREQG